MATWILALKRIDSSRGFLLPDSSVHSPDASLMRLERRAAMSEAERRGFPPLCTDLVVELGSASDSPASLRCKMEGCSANGARLGWLMLPVQRTVSLAPQPMGRQKHCQYC